MGSIRQRGWDKNGKERFQVEIRLKGHPTITQTIIGKTAAKNWLQKKEAEIRAGRQQLYLEREKHTFKEAVERFKIEFSVPTWKKGHLEWWTQELGPLYLQNIRPSIINEKKKQKLIISTLYIFRGDFHNLLTYNQLRSSAMACVSLWQNSAIDCRSKYCKTRLRKMYKVEIITCNEKGNLRSKATVNRYLATLSHLLSVVTKQWEWLYENPVKKITREKEPRGRTRFLNPEERKRLLESCQQSDNELLPLFVILLLSTGCRYNEIRNLRWTDIDLVLGRITLHETKNGEIRSVPLRGLGLDLLRKRSAECNSIGYVFVLKRQSHPMDPRRTLKTTIKRAGLKDIRPHDFRHSYASEMLAQGLSLGEIGHLLGHKSASMTKRYAHLVESRSIDAVEKMSERIFKEV